MRYEPSHDGAPRRSEVTAVVLCGGASRRMGTDKAKLELDGRWLIERPLEAARAVAERVLLACGVEPRYPELGLECVLDEFRDGDGAAGPLAGLLAGLEAARSPWVVALACDLPLARADVLEGLLATAEHHRLDACLLELERGTQPLLAAYRREPCRRAVRAALERGERRMVAFHAGLAVGSVAAEHLGPAAQAAALNLNTPEDFRALERSGRLDDKLFRP